MQEVVGSSPTVSTIEKRPSRRFFFFVPKSKKYRVTVSENIKIKKRKPHGVVNIGFFGICYESCGFSVIAKYNPSVR